MSSTQEIKQLLQQHPGSIPSLELYHILDSVNFEERDMVFSELLKRVKINGLVYIKGVDINVLCDSIHNGHIANPEEIFGKYKSLSRLDLVYEQLQSMNFSVLVSERNGEEYYLVGKRNA